jgi:hypothetical protein
MGDRTLCHFSPKLGTPIPAGYSGERAEQPSLRSHDANFGLGDGAQMIPLIAAPVELDALPRNFGEPGDRCGCDELIAGTFERGLRPLGIDLRLVSEGLQTEDAAQRRIGQIGPA